MSWNPRTVINRVFSGRGKTRKEVWKKRRKVSSVESRLHRESGTWNPRSREPRITIFYSRNEQAKESKEAEQWSICVWADRTTRTFELQRTCKLVVFWVPARPSTMGGRRRNLPPNPDPASFFFKTSNFPLKSLISHSLHFLHDFLKLSGVKQSYFATSLCLIYLSIYLLIYLSTSLPRDLATHLPIYLAIHFPIYLSTYLSNTQKM